MRINSKLKACVAFARFCENHKAEPFDLAELLALADAAFAAGEREANTGRSADCQRERFEAKAKEMGFGVEWPGLLPALTRNGQTIHLPAV